METINICFGDFWSVFFSIKFSWDMMWNCTCSTAQLHSNSQRDEFSPLLLRWVLPAAWPRAAAPEATHRCAWQPAQATIPWSRGSPRPRRPRMRETFRAMASDEDWGENLMKHGIPLWGEVNEDVDGLSFLWWRLHPFHQNPKNCSWASGVCILMWTHVTAAFVQVS